MKKIPGFKQKEDQIDGCLDRVNELNIFFNKFSLETSSAFSSPAHSQADIPPSFDLQDTQLSCNTSNVLSSTSLPPPSTCVSRWNPGEETTGKTELEQGCRSRSCQP
ncbi:hypothetical protein ATANTOWER_021922 [Ataeniobius toweri]|uniref:Uncharacterized protein n=1 Tax=Ataeniobius toweri TaxID=208326 RepID=A0ABU7C9P5_9TELE|nr:hypothetical protein [Ataeniobius toweri]